MDTIFFIVSKILPLLLFPLPFVILLGLTLVFKYGFRGKRIIHSIPFLILWLYSTNAFSQILIQPLEDEYPRLSLNEVPNMEIAIVLGGMFNNLTRYSDHPELTSSVDRLISAIELYKQGKVKKILFTGGSGALFYNSVSEGDQARKFFSSMGIPEKDLIIEDKSRNTRENAIYVNKLLNKHNLNQEKLVLITSAFHMGRSVRSFENAGMKVIPYPCDYRTLHRNISFFENWIPNSGSLDTTSVAIKEWLGRPVYWIYNYTSSNIDSAK